MTVQAQTVATTTLSEVIAYFDQVEHQFDPKTVDRFRAKAERALDTGVDKVTAFMALGIIYTYEKNFTRASFYFKNASMVMPNNEIVVKNYAGHLKSFGLFAESVDVLIEFLDKNKSNFFPGVYELALDYALYSGQYQKLTIKLSEKLTYCDDSNRETCAHKANYAINAMKLDIENKRTDTMNIEAIKLIGRFVEHNGHHVVDVSSRILSDEYDTWIAYHFGIDTTDRGIVRKLNNKLCDWLADQIEDYHLFSGGASFRLGAMSNGN